MEHERHDRERRPASVARALASLLPFLLLITFFSCGRPLPASRSDLQTPAGRRTGEGPPGFSLRGTLLESNAELPVPEAAESIRLQIVLPDGYVLAEGFPQQLTVMTSAGETTSREVSLTNEPTGVALPPDERMTLEVAIGYCAEKAKDICYVDRAELTLVRKSDAPSDSDIMLEYRPGAHL